ncbi:MAG: hypothetical protein HGA51_04790, partial [Demequinaceae bacterium]|nr:hypothetical protein [Demequinaceae bacterium]
MRLTIHRSLTRHGDVDLEVARGTPLHEVVAAFPAACVWCGDVMLEQEHEAGEWPLVAGAILSAHPRHGAVRPHALHLAAIAGPDAGITIPLESATIIGSAPPSVMVRDDAVDARHTTVSPANEGALRVKDDGSVNGTAVWSLRGDTLSWRGRRRATTIHVGDVIVIGHTLLEARREPVQADADAQRADGAPSLAPALRRVVSAARAATLTALADARAAITRLPGSWGTTRPRGAPLLEGCPDPTRAAGWSDPIAVFGPHAVELARAVILARGRRPPHPPPFDETWMSWLPTALPDDGRIRIATNSAAT